MSTSWGTQPIRGILHAYVAFDWGEEGDLARAQGLVPAEITELSRRPRTRIAEHREQTAPHS
jgi:hypothetical protein